MERGHSYPPTPNWTAPARIPSPWPGLCKSRTAQWVETLGAGGGSIGWIDSLGLLQVGPQSAGSQPGPACYGQGGIEPTISDANLVLGYLSPDGLLGGSLPLDLEKARAAVAKIAGPLDLSIE